MRVIAVFEGVKAIVVLLAGFEALRFLHRDVRSAAEELLRHLHLDPVARLPRLVLNLADQITPGMLLGIAVGALAYAILRFAEGYGLWHNRNWAKWLGAVSGAIYFPYEIYELGRGITLLRAATFLINVAVVAFLSWSIMNSRRTNGAAALERPPGN
jgi:uncharacterized membrane protein (DUF2068 family)